MLKLKQIYVEFWFDLVCVVTSSFHQENLIQPSNGIAVFAFQMKIRNCVQFQISNLQEPKKVDRAKSMEEVHQIELT